MKEVITPRIRLGKSVKGKVMISVSWSVNSSVYNPVWNSVRSIVNSSVDSSVYRLVTGSIKNRL